MLELMRRKTREIEETKQLWVDPALGLVYMPNSETLKHVAQLFSKEFLKDPGPSVTGIPSAKEGTMPGVFNGTHQGKNSTDKVKGGTGAMESSFTPMVQ